MHCCRQTRSAFDPEVQPQEKNTDANARYNYLTFNVLGTVLRTAEWDFHVSSAAAAVSYQYM